MTPLDVLLIHNNFPGQFRNLTKSLAAMSDVRVRSIGARLAPGITGIPMERYSFAGGEMGAVHAFARRFELECRRSEQVIYAANTLKLSGFMPKLIYVHPGWGEALPLRALFPDAVICAYAEFYYRPSGTDVGFDKEFPQLGIDGEARVIARNAATLLAMADANFAIAPTQWQRSVFPAELHAKIHVVHDGIDTAELVPAAAPRGEMLGGHRFDAHDEIVTFVARNLEPYRGFHIFMRALPTLLALRPQARICIVGGDQVSYGSAPTGHANWREAMLHELGGTLPRERVHFMGRLPYGDYLALLRRSDAHVYLTYPFVLSWSMLEAMALECLVIGSDTPPVAEVIEDGFNGLLVPFFEPETLAETIADALARPERHRALRTQARRTVVERYDYQYISWPDHLRLIQEHAYFTPWAKSRRDTDQPS
jgi:glycosyltransferase involved in cell wall biosynthesis